LYDERSVLKYALPDLQAPLVQLALKVISDKPVSARLHEAPPELPHLRVSQATSRENPWPLEAKSIGYLALQLRVTEPILSLMHVCLKDIYHFPSLTRETT
jgi:hypothetical protein